MWPFLFSVASAPRIFKKVLMPVLGLLSLSEILLIVIFGQSSAGKQISLILDSKVSFKMGTLRTLNVSWILRSHLWFCHIMWHTWAFSWITIEPMSSYLRMKPQSQVQKPQSQWWSSLQSFMQVLGLMMSSFNVVPFSQFLFRPFQKIILTVWDISSLYLDKMIQLHPRTKMFLSWWLLYLTSSNTSI